MRWQGALRQKYSAASTWMYTTVIVWAYETYQGPFNCINAMEVPILEEGLLLKFLAQTATAIQEEARSMDINNKNYKNPTPSLWAQETQQAPNRTWKGVYPRFQGFFVVVRFIALHCFQHWLREDSGARCHLDPLENWWSGRGNGGVKRRRRERGKGCLVPASDMP